MPLGVPVRSANDGVRSESSPEKPILGSLALKKGS